MGSWKALLGCIRGALVSAVNVKFLRFTYAFTIAALVGVMTLLSVGAITYKLVTTCSLTCRSIPLALLATEQLSKLSCVAFKTRAMGLTVSPNEQSRQVFNSLMNNSGNPSTEWTAFSWAASAATVGKCSYLHATECGLVEWLATFQGLAALANIGNHTTSISTAAWPQLATFYASKSSLDQQIDAALAAAKGTTRLAGAAVQNIIAAGGAVLSPNATILEAPSTAACCDVTARDTKLGLFGGGSSRFVVNIRGRQNLEMDTSSCATNSGTTRCSWVSLSTAVQLLPAGLWLVAAACWHVSFCVPIVGETGPKAAPMQLCLNGTMNNVLVPLTNYYDITGSCPTAGNPTSTAVATAKSWPAQQLAATVKLLPLAVEFGMAITAYMASAQVDIESAAQGLNAIKNDNEAASWWMENMLYCCSESCPTWLSSIGSALGYETYIEGGIALIVILVYLACFKPERERLGLQSLKGIYNVAFEVQATTEDLPAAGGGNAKNGASNGEAADGAAAQYQEGHTVSSKAGRGDVKGAGVSDAGYVIAHASSHGRSEAHLHGTAGTAQVAAWPEDY